MNIFKHFMNVPTRARITEVEKLEEKKHYYQDKYHELDKTIRNLNEYFTF